jgi:hypothetical protein
MPVELPRFMQMGTEFPKSILNILNQLYHVEQKLNKFPEASDLRRNINKMKDAFAEEGLPFADSDGHPFSIRLAFEDPMGQPFKETRTDLDATIAGTGTDNLVVVEVIKPIIRVTVKGDEVGSSKIVQRGIVIVESRKEN